MGQKLSLSDLSLTGKKVLMRVDFNVPVDNLGRITDDTRIKAAIPSIRYVLDHGGSLILMSHRGRPKGKYDPALSLKPCAERLAMQLHREVEFQPNCIGNDVTKQAANLQPGQILMLENLRFHRSEEHPQEHPHFAQELAALGDYYVNDAFGTCHRAHASTTDVAQHFPGKAAAGFLLQKEIKFLGSALTTPMRPFHALIGGAKISTKIGTLHALLKRVDLLCIGGAMAFTFLKAKGIEIGNSLWEEEYLEGAKRLLHESQVRGVEILLPVDLLIADKISVDAQTKLIDAAKGIPAGWQGVDIGPKTIKLFSDRLIGAETIFWSGPMGIFEIPAFAKGTNEIAKALARCQALVVVGGGDSVAAMHAAGVADQITHLSTGGGAALEFIEFGSLPGIDALSSAPLSGS